MEAPAPVTHPGKLLKEELLTRLARNPHYSLRAMARDLGVSHAYVSVLFSEKKRLSVSRAIDFAQRLSLDEAKKQRLVASAVKCYETEIPSRGWRPPQKKRDYLRLDLDRFKLIAEWYHLPILDLSQTQGFRPELGWIARELGISAGQARNAVSRLKRLGLLEVRGKVWNVRPFTEILPEKSFSAVRRFHEQMIQKALDSLSDPDSFALRSISGITIPADPDRLEKAKKRIFRFRRDMLNLLSEGKPKRVYQLNIQLFPLQNPSTRRRET